MPLKDFWPRGGPRWDGLACTKDGKLILVEAKAHINEAVDYGSRATGDALCRIIDRLEEAKSAFSANNNACWRAPLYQMANRFAHFYYLAGINKLDAYLVFIYFANAPDVHNPASRKEWQGAIRLAYKCLGIGMRNKGLAGRVAKVIVDLNHGNGQLSACAYGAAQRR